MSKGLGKMQRQILLGLEESKEWANESKDPLYRGHGYMAAYPNIVTAQGKRTRLGDGVFDLSATQTFLAKKAGKCKVDCFSNKMYVDEYFAASFWRASLCLRRRGLLLSCHPSARQKRLVYLSDAGKSQVEHLLSVVVITTTLTKEESSTKAMIA